MIVQNGSINLAAAQRPGVIVNIIPPSVSPILGVPSNVEAVVGTATWGPVNAPVTIGNYPQYQQNFGSVQNRTFDMGTQVAVAVQQGASNFRCVRVTDGTDTAAACEFNFSSPNFSAKLTSYYTGTTGNGLVAKLETGSAASTWKLTLSMPNTQPEVYDNIAAPTAATFWANLVSAVNNGNGALRGKSKIAVATIGTLTSTAPASGYTGTNGTGNTGSLSAVSGGTDGATTITGSVLLGTDGTGSSRTGMYALRNTGARILNIADLTDTTQWATVNAFALSEGMYPIFASAIGDTVSNLTTTKAAAGLDTAWAKVMLGDWCYWNDTTNGLVRLVSPAAFVAGLFGNQVPSLSALNKRLVGVTGTQKSATNTVYSDADILQMMSAGIDVIANPSPGGAYYSCATGHNASSNAAIRGDNYTLMVNFLAPTLNAAMGFAVGQLQSASQRLNVIAALDNFMMTLWRLGLIGNASGSYPNGPQPWSIELDDANNPQDSVALGFEIVNLQVQFLSVVEVLVVNMEAGQNVRITRQPVTVAPNP